MILHYSCASAKVWLFIVDPCMYMYCVNNKMWCTHAFTHIPHCISMATKVIPISTTLFMYMRIHACTTISSHLAGNKVTCIHAASQYTVCTSQLSMYTHPVISSNSSIPSSIALFPGRTVAGVHNIAMRPNIIQYTTYSYRLSVVMLNWVCTDHEN